MPDPRNGETMREDIFPQGGISFMERTLSTQHVNEPNAVAHAGALRRVATSLASDADLDPLIDRIGDARLVLLGEASHGTSEFYEWRRLITERLVQERGFDFLAVEGDWPDCYAVTRYLQGLDDARSPREVLEVFKRWPTWMWANEEVASLVQSLERFNDEHSENDRVGFYGLDVYSLWRSLHAVLDFVEKAAPDRHEQVRNAYRCFEPFDDVEEYARAATWGLGNCESAASAMLAEMRTIHPVQAGADAEAVFDAELNATVVLNAERYYRAMVRGGGESWNIRDRHMAATLDRLLDRHGPASKAIVWAHNTHIGDARATDMARAGMVNLGQLVRENYAKDDVVLVGFGSYQGSVIAGDGWNAPMKRMSVPPARPESWEHAMHAAFDASDRLLIFDDKFRRAPEMQERRGHRAIGVVYHPDDERGNYVPTDLTQRYDAFVFLDRTSAVHPLTKALAAVEDPDLPETFPEGF